MNKTESARPKGERRPQIIAGTAVVAKSCRGRAMMNSTAPSWIILFRMRCSCVSTDTAAWLGISTIAFPAGLSETKIC
jgi:hypothetical protein